MLKNKKNKISKKLDPKININKSYLPSSIKVDKNGGEGVYIKFFKPTIYIIHNITLILHLVHIIIVTQHQVHILISTSQIIHITMLTTHTAHTVS